MNSNPNRIFACILALALAVAAVPTAFAGPHPGGAHPAFGPEPEIGVRGPFQHTPSTAPDHPVFRNPGRAQFGPEPQYPTPRVDSRRHVSHREPGPSGFGEAERTGPSPEDPNARFRPDEAPRGNQGPDPGRWDPSLTRF